MLAVTVLLAANVRAEPVEGLSYERDIRPIFRAHCFDCHGAEDEKKGELDLRLVRFLKRGGKSGPAIFSGAPSKSRILARVRAGEMPPGSVKLSAEEMDTLERWIAAGARTLRPEPETIPPGVGISEEEREFWAYQRLRRPERPEESSERTTPIDAFLGDAMKPHGFAFSPQASPRELMLRLFFDLTGLPPEKSQVEAFSAECAESDSAFETAYGKLVDRLLQSPRFGERWARHWLDVAGYADSEGGVVSDLPRPWAYKYRDWVIASLQSDKPIDEFIVEQLAGDELAGVKKSDWTSKQIDLLTATGFLRMAVDGTTRTNDAPTRNKVISDTLGIVGSSLFGLSVACAECHDHRYDPIPQRDYYALRAVFEPAFNFRKWRQPNARRVSLYTLADKKAAAEIEQNAQKIAAEKAQKQTEFIALALTKELEKYAEPLRSKLRAAYETSGNKRSAEQADLLKKYPSVNISPGVLYQYNQGAADKLKAYDARMASLRASKPKEEFLRVLSEPGGALPKTHLFHRGDYRQPKGEVQPGTLQVLRDPSAAGKNLAPDKKSSASSGRRLAFARWVVGDENPLTARVFVNRVWLHLFGRGIVDTPGDFGKLGALPTHPKLLDWLAAEFREDGWSLKRLIRRVVMSRTYRQSSVSSPVHIEKDRSNRWLSRQSVRRLDAEIIRDRMLAVTGELELTEFGPSVQLALDATGQAVTKSKRRSLYLETRRTRPDSLLQAFDAPVMKTNCDKRIVSTAATQSLMLMNGEFVLARARALAERIIREAPPIENADQAAQGAWVFGYGSVESGNLTGFALLPHSTGSGFQGGPKLPDPSLGWALIRKGGGHPGDSRHATVVRFRAHRDGRVSFKSRLGHASGEGDGVRARVFLANSVLGDWVAHNQTVETALELNLKQGETISFVVDCRGGHSFDSYSWPLELNFVDAARETFRASESFSQGVERPLPPLARLAWSFAYSRDPDEDEELAAVEFLTAQSENLVTAKDGKQGDPSLEALTNLCHMLLISNEFLYVE